MREMDAALTGAAFPSAARAVRARVGASACQLPVLDRGDPDAPELPVLAMFRADSRYPVQAAFSTR